MLADRIFSGLIGFAIIGGYPLLIELLVSILIWSIDDMRREGIKIETLLPVVFLGVSVLASVGIAVAAIDLIAYSLFGIGILERR